MKPITTPEQHAAALARIEDLWDAPEHTWEAEEFNQLIDLVVEYEKEWIESEFF